MSRLVDADVPGAKVLKALTLWQPWASLCFIPRPCECRPYWPEGHPAHVCACDRSPFKTIETRSWPAPKSLIGQRIAIHAAKRPMVGWELSKIGFGQRSVVTPGAPRPVGADWLTLRGVDVIDLHSPGYGCVLGTAVLADCVPMANPRWTDPVRPYLWVNEDEEDAPHDLVLYRDGVHGENVSDQAPFGHFEQGRWAWLLADVERFDEPIPARGGQHIWNWERP